MVDLLVLHFLTAQRVLEGKIKATASNKTPGLSKQWESAEIEEEHLFPSFSLSNSDCWAATFFKMIFQGMVWEKSIVLHITVVNSVAT